MDLRELEKRLERGGFGTVVATIGTTAVGSVDPLPQLLELRARYGFRLHADAAYGGYFILADNLDPQLRSSLDRLNEVDSIVIDPHKHGKATTRRTRSCSDCLPREASRVPFPEVSGDLGRAPAGEIFGTA